MKKKKTIENLLITGVADKGMCVGRTDENEVIFVDGVVPGDVVDVLVIRKRKNYSQGIAQNFKSFSKDRTKVFCKHFWECGGCKWQHMSYSAQCKYKWHIVADAMYRIGRLQEIEIKPLIPAPTSKYYRNKLEFSFSDKRWLTKEEVARSEDIQQGPALGFHKPGYFDKILDIQECFLMDSKQNDIRNFVREYTLNNGYSYYDQRSHKGLMRNLIIRNTTLGEWMVTVAFGHRDDDKIFALLDAINNEFDFITSLNYVVNEKVNDTIMDQKIINYSGREYIVEQLGKIKYQIGLKSFFQTNTHQAKTLYDVVVDFADLDGTEIVYDLYTGLGSIALYVAERARSVTGIEEIPEAIEDAWINAEFNNIKNVNFYAGDVRNILNEEFVEKHGRADVIITDPPRSGMHEDVVNTLLQCEAPKIVYVSCNPATQARDLLMLSEKYQVVKIQPVDMFPQTHHIENVALLKLKK